MPLNSPVIVRLKTRKAAEGFPGGLGFFHILKAH